MILASVPAPAALAAPPQHHGFGFGVVRPGGPDAPPAADVIAQAVVELPMNFGGHALIDVSMGTRLGAWDSIEAARAGARELAQDRATVGLVTQYRPDGEVTFSAVELLVPNFEAVPFGNDAASWSGVKQTGLVIGRDSTIGNRFVEELWAVDGADHTRPRIAEILTGKGAMRLEFEYQSEGRRSRVQPVLD